MKKFHFLMKRLSFMLMAAALPLVGMAQRVSLPYGYAARGGMSYCPNTYLPGWMAVDLDQPVQDATFLIANPDFSSGTDGWNYIKPLTVTDGQASTSGVFDVYQELEGIPNGVYELGVNGFYKGKKSPRCAWLYAGNNTMALKSKAEGSGDLSSGEYARTVRTIVINHSLRIGVKGIYSTCGETSFDNFRLSYVGKYVVGFEATIAENYTGEEAVTVPVGSWKAGQQVAVHADNAAYLYKALGNGEQTTLVAGNNDNRFPRQNDSYTAARPYDKVVLAETGTTLTLQQTQNYVAGGIDTLANPMAAFSDNATLAFKNVCGLLQLNLTGDNVGVKSINVKANNDAKLCGTGTLSFDNDNLTWIYVENGGDNVSLVVPGEETVSLGANATPFYIALPPANYSSGLTITVTDGTDDNTCTIELGETAISRSAVTAADATVVYKSLKVPASLVLGMDNIYETKTLTADVVPSTSTVEWSCSSTGVVELSSTTGKSITVTAKDAGTATITATATNGLTATCTVNVVTLKAFSVSTGTQVHFSTGNLWYDQTPETGGQYWGFEANQYDFRTYPNNGSMLGGTYSTNSGTPTDTYGLFGWGDAPANGVNIKTSIVSSYTWPNSGDPWGSKIGEGWRTLTEDEWEYILNVDNAASGARDKNWTRYAKATVTGVPGLLVFPDGTTGTTIGGVEINSVNVKNAAFDTNTIGGDNWSSLESAGVVFLPCAGYRYGVSVSNVGTKGLCWSSSYSSTFGLISKVYYLDFYSGNVNLTSNNNRYYGYSVRLATPLVPAESVSLNNTTMPLEVGGNETLTATLSPSNTTDVVTWSSDNTSVATVDPATGEVTAVAVGTATITATAREGVYAECEVTVIPEGALPGKFTVSSNKTVYFSKGNLWYDKTPENGGQYWGFEANQYDFRTYPGKGSMLNETYSAGSGTPADTYGLFGWGDAPEDGDINTSKTNSEYIWPDSGDPWGSKIGDGWRTLTQGEWAYLLNVDGSGGRDAWARFAKATVMDIPGLIVFPDNMTGTTIDFTIKSVNVIDAYFTANEIADNSTWSSMETAGCVFLPCAGFRNGTSVRNVGSRGDYWSSAYDPDYSDDYAYGLRFSSDGVNPACSDLRCYGSSVRLVTLLPVPATGVSLDKTTMTLELGSSGTLEATLSPSNTTDAVTWSSNKPSVATVDPATGEVTAVAAGTAVITATAREGVYAECEVAVAAPVGAIPGLFTVGMDGDTPIKVYFSKGNMYWDGNSSSYKFEANQYDYRMHYEHDDNDAFIDGITKETPTNTVGSFLWVNNTQDAPNPYDWGVTSLSGATRDFLFTNATATTPNTSFTVNGQEGVWRALSGGDSGEWKYLLETRNMTYNKPRYTNAALSGVTIGGSTYKGLFIYPDDYNGNEVGVEGGPSTWNNINANGIVFLPCAGYRDDSSVSYVGSIGYYWSSTVRDATYAYFLYFNSGDVNPVHNYYRYDGFSVRLVCAVLGTLPATPL